jgi:hypothetical protein
MKSQLTALHHEGAGGRYVQRLRRQRPGLSQHSLGLRRGCCSGCRLRLIALFVPASGEDFAAFYVSFDV